jgi:HK97 family phage major capsid protein
VIERRRLIAAKEEILMADKLSSALFELRQDLGDGLSAVAQREKSLMARFDDILGKTPGAGRTLKAALLESPSFQRLLTTKVGTASIEFKSPNPATYSVLTSGDVGYATTGTLPLDRTPGITPERRPQIVLEPLLSRRTTTRAIVDFIRSSGPLGTPAAQVEGDAKYAQTGFGLESASMLVRTYASYLDVTDQLLADVDALANFLDVTLRFMVDWAFEYDLINGDGAGSSLAGLLSQATPANPALLPSPFYLTDIPTAAQLQLAEAKELQPDFIICNPADVATLRFLKNSVGAYAWNELAAARGMLQGLRVLSTLAMPQNSWLVGSSSPIAVELIVREETMFTVSRENADNFSKNVITCKAERRACLLTKRPGSYISGVWVGSPQ